MCLLYLLCAYYTFYVLTILQVMEEKLDVNNVEVAAVKLPTPPPGLSDPVTAACHYVTAAWSRGHSATPPEQLLTLCMAPQHGSLA